MPGWIILPQQVDQPICRHQTPRVKQQQPQQASLSAAAKRHRMAIPIPRFHPPEQQELHAAQA
jgi:hypothetical protein